MTAELEKWLDYIVTYSMFCKSEAKGRWIFELQNFIANANNRDTEEVSLKQHYYEVASVIIKMIFDNDSWESIKDYFYKNCSGILNKAEVLKTIMNYSEHGLEFFEQVFQVSDLEVLSELYKIYSDKKLTEEMKRMNL